VTASPSTDICLLVPPHLEKWGYKKFFGSLCSKILFCTPTLKSVVPPLSKCTYIVVCLHHIEGTYDWSAQLPVNYSKVLTTGQPSYLWITRRYLRLVSSVTCELLEGTYDWSAQLPVNYLKVLMTGQPSYLWITPITSVQRCKIEV